MSYCTRRHKKKFKDSFNGRIKKLIVLSQNASDKRSQTFVLYFLYAQQIQNLE